MELRIAWIGKNKNLWLTNTKKDTFDKPDLVFTKREVELARKRAAKVKL